MEKQCKRCRQKFDIQDNEENFYKKIDVKPPTFCPDCRQQRRITYRNERSFYKRKCDLTGKEIISVYSPDTHVKVYGSEEFWSDKTNGLEYGREFDFSRPFFEQFDELSTVAPRPAMINYGSENSIYTNHSAYNKNCYMCINTGWCEDCLYISNYSMYNKNCMDSLSLKKSELCYFCTDVKVATNSSYLYECVNCHDSNFLYDCHSCSNCFMCFNLRHKQNYILNKKYSSEEYEKQLKELMPKTAEEYEKTFQQLKDLMRDKAIHKYAFSENNENSTGDILSNNKNTKDSYCTFDCEDVAYVYDCGALKDSLDATEPFQGELQYETHACNKGYKLLSCSKCYEDNDLMYCQYCWNSSDLFGCFGLKKNKYCILNKQYSEEEYKKILPKIIEHMKKTGEWGEFFPSVSSTFAYNETIANDYYPLTKEQAVAQGFKWKDKEKKEYQPQKYKVPELIKDVPDDIIKEVLACAKCGKNYRIAKEELNLYRKLNLPIPQKCYDCRHLDRMSLRNPRKLWDRKCSKCGMEIKTTYSTQRPETVYCEGCYLESIM
ncbi:MAG: hypothetical protein WC806_01175 [Candidatus Gracilibacteria bacterium]|jgi:hypothetical protein